MKKIFIGNLPDSTTEDELQCLFSEFGKVCSFKLMKDIFSGKCKGFGFIEMEGHHARDAIANLNGKYYKGNSLKVSLDFSSARCRRR